MQRTITKLYRPQVPRIALEELNGVFQVRSARVRLPRRALFPPTSPETERPRPFDVQEQWEEEGLIMIEPMDDEYADAVVPLTPRPIGEEEPEEESGSAIGRGTAFKRTGLASECLELIYVPFPSGRRGQRAQREEGEGEEEENDEPVQYLCNHCFYSSYDEAEYLGHVYGHLFKCDLCSHVTRTRAAAMAHTARAHPTVASQMLRPYALRLDGWEQAVRADVYFGVQSEERKIKEGEESSPMGEGWVEFSLTEEEGVEASQRGEGWEESSLIGEGWVVSSLTEEEGVESFPTREGLGEDVEWDSGYYEEGEM